MVGYRTKEFFEIFPRETLNSAARSLYSSYVNNWDYFDSTFESFFSIPYNLVFRGLDKSEFIFDLLSLYYRNEFFVKKRFEDDYALTDYIEELPLLKSRIDIATINHAYEIKTKYDSLLRLSKQISDYSKCFEHVTVVCSEDKCDEVFSLIPDYCGVISYKDRSNCAFSVKRKATLSFDISPLSQLEFMHLSEIRKIFRSEDRLCIASNFESKEINAAFKECLKNRIKKRAI